MLLSIYEVRGDLILKWYYSREQCNLNNQNLHCIWELYKNIKIHYLLLLIWIKEREKKTN